MVVDGYDFTINAFEPNFKENIDFWNAIKKSNNYKVGYRTETQVFLSDEACGIIPKAPVGEDIKIAVIWNLIFKFSQEDYPTASDVPVTVFDRCVAV